MRKRIRYFLGAILMIASVLMTQVPTQADAAGKAASAFQMEGNVLVKYTGTQAKVTIPSGVEEIGKSAFENNVYLEEVSIPSGVKKIGAYAFWGCNRLTKVTGCSGMTAYDDYAFANCPALSELSIPSNIERIGIMAFADDTGLKALAIPYTVTEIHDTAFDGCSRLELSVIPGTEGARFAELFAVKKEEMPEYEDVPDYLPQESEKPVKTPTPIATSTPMPPVRGNELGSSSVVGNMAVVFMDNTAPNVYMGTEEGMLSAQPTPTPDQMLEGEEEHSGKGIELFKYTLIDGRIIADHCYYADMSLGTVRPEGSVREIGEFSYARSSVRELLLQPGIEKIDYAAFYHCDRLTRVEIPATVTRIEAKAFTYTPWLKEFMENGASDFLIVGDGILLAYRGNAAQVQLPEGIKSIAPYVFEKHTELKKIGMPHSLTHIGEGAFQECTGLTEISGMDGICTIEDLAFYQCPALSLTLPKTVRELGLNAFGLAEGTKEEGKIVLQSAPSFTSGRVMQRLTNEELRKDAFCGRSNVGLSDGTPPTGTAEKGFSVSYDGDVQAECSLSGYDHSYRFAVKTVTEEGLSDREKLENFQAAFQRIYHDKFQPETVYLELQLTDLNTGTEITRLGKQGLEMILTIPERFREQDFALYTIDRNGQLERIRFLRDGEKMQFRITHLSTYALCSTEDPLLSEMAGENGVHITGLGPKDDSPYTGEAIQPKYILAFGLFLCGLGLVFIRKRK